MFIEVEEFVMFRQDFQRGECQCENIELVVYFWEFVVLKESLILGNDI